MKIVGITYCEGTKQLYLKPDSALLVGGKPFFLPPFGEQVVAHWCLVGRINRLGRNIEEKFAHRYYDAYTWGLNIQVLDELQKGYKGDAWTRATAFDNSLVVGEMVPVTEPLLKANWVCTLEQAIAQSSRYITLRMGDLVAVDSVEPPFLLEREQVIEKTFGSGHLYCKVK